MIASCINGFHANNRAEKTNQFFNIRKAVLSRNNQTRNKETVDWMEDIFKENYFVGRAVFILYSILLFLSFILNKDFNIETEIEFHGHALVATDVPKCIRSFLSDLEYDSY
jgi:hypothetical protein